MDKDYAANLLETIAGEDESRDFTLVAGINERRFPVHRNIMAASSEYFRDLFKANLGNVEVFIKDIDGVSLKLIIDFCYTGRIPLTEENIDDVLTVASTMELTMLKQNCYTFLETNLSTKNVVLTLRCADKFGFTKLREQTFTKVCNNFEKVPIAEILQLDEHIFREMLSVGRIVACEALIFDRVEQWVNGNEIDRAKHALNLLKLIKLERLPAKFFCEKVDPFCEKYDCSEPLLAEYRRRSTSKSTVKYAPTVIEKPPIEDRCACALKLSSGILEFRKFNVFLQKWTKFGTIAILASTFYQSVVHDKRIIIFERKSNEITAIKAMSLRSQRIHFIPEMLDPATDVKCISVCKYFYVLAQTPDTDRRMSFQRFRFKSLYHPNHGVWESRTPPPSTFINIHSAVRVARCIYFVMVNNCEGNNGKLLCYNTRKNTWSEIAKIQLEPEEPDVGRTHDVAIFRSKNTLYAIVSPITSGNVLYKYQSTTDTWTKIREVGTQQIERTVEFIGETYAFTSNKEFGIVSPETGAFFTKICDISDGTVAELFVPRKIEKIGDFSAIV